MARLPPRPTGRGSVATRGGVSESVNGSAVPPPPPRYLSCSQGGGPEIPGMSIGGW